MSLTSLLISVNDLALRVISVFKLRAKRPFGINFVTPPACSKALVSVNHTTYNDIRYEEIYYTSIILNIFLNGLLILERFQNSDKSNSFKLLFFYEMPTKYIFFISSLREHRVLFESS